MNEENEVIISSTEIQAYNPFRQQLADLKKSNDNAVFDYADPKGNKEARSHVYALRQTKTAVDKVRKEQKQDSLRYGRMVDSEAKDIAGELDAMINVHLKPIQEIEEIERARVSGLQEKLTVLKNCLEADFEFSDLNMLLASIEKLESIAPDESFQEFTAEAMTIYKKASERLALFVDKRKAEDEKQKELESLKQEKEERERLERDKQIAEDAAKKAKEVAEAAALKAQKEADEAHQKELRRIESERVDAEAQSRADILAAEKQVKDKSEAAKKAKKDADEATERALKIAEEDKQNAINKEREDQKAAQDEANRVIEEQRLAEEKRTSKKAHRRKLMSESVDAIAHKISVDRETAIIIVSQIEAGNIPNITINF